jgi:hypothetical protein
MPSIQPRLFANFHLDLTVMTELSHAYLFQAAFLAITGILILTNANVLRTFRRSTVAGVLLAGSAVALLAWNLWNLSEPDLAGFPRMPVVVVFSIAGLAAFIWMPDLIAVRGLGALMLFFARGCLDAGWMKLPDSLLCASISYAILAIPGLWWAASPGAFSVHMDMVLATPLRRRATGVFLCLLAFAAVTSAWRLSFVA